MEEASPGVAPEVEGIGRILFLGEGEDGRRYLSIEFKKRKEEEIRKAIYLFMESGIEFEKGTIDHKGNVILLLSVRRLNPWEL